MWNLIWNVCGKKKERAHPKVGALQSMELVILSYLIVNTTVPESPLAQPCPTSE
jgi:hypothetical protein